MNPSRKDADELHCRALAKEASERKENKEGQRGKERRWKCNLLPHRRSVFNKSHFVERTGLLSNIHPSSAGKPLHWPNVKAVALTCESEGQASIHLEPTSSLPGLHALP